MTYAKQGLFHADTLWCSFLESTHNLSFGISSKLQRLVLCICRPCLCLCFHKGKKMHGVFCSYSFHGLHPIKSKQISGLRKHRLYIFYEIFSFAIGLKKTGFLILKKFAPSLTGSLKEAVPRETAGVAIGRGNPSPSVQIKARSRAGCAAGGRKQRPLAFPVTGGKSICLN